jgi:uncharacterized protein (DUF1800 family)
VAHLLRRAGFGGDAAQVGTLAALDRTEIVDRLLDFGTNPADPPPPSLADPDRQDWERIVDLQQWWLDRMATVPSPLQEKLALFWHGHFASSGDKVGSALDMYEQNHLFRTEGTGSFENLVQRTSVQVAMLVYLDNEANSKGAPNENFARELMELFTLGVNQYTQADVVAAARAWTGHNVDYGVTPRAYRFFPFRHDTGNKTFLGTTQAWDGPQIITRLLTVEPQRSIAAKFIAKKLWTFFAHPDPAPALVDDLASTFVASGLDVKTLLRAIFLRDEMYGTRARQGLVRSPVDWVVACLRATQMSAVATNPQWWMEAMGQQLFYPPNVAGWKNNAYWLTSTGLGARAAFARSLSWQARVAHGDHPVGFLREITATHQAVVDGRDRTVYDVPTADAVARAFSLFGRDPAVDPPGAHVRSVLATWLAAQRVAEQEPPWSWREYSPLNLATMTMLTPDVQLA